MEKTFVGSSIIGNARNSLSASLTVNENFIIIKSAISQTISFSFNEILEIQEEKSFGGIIIKHKRDDYPERIIFRTFLKSGTSIIEEIKETGFFNGSDNPFI